MSLINIVQIKDLLTTCVPFTGASLDVNLNGKILSNVLTPLIYGSTAANEDITIEGTSSATKTTSYVILQPTGGQVNIGALNGSSPISSLNIVRGISGGTFSNGVFSSGSVLSDVTGTARHFASFATTEASAFNVLNLNHYEAIQSTLGAGSSVTNQVGFIVGTSLTSATNNWGFRGMLAAATGRYNLYMDGTAQNYLAGNVGIGTIAPATKLDVRTNVAYRGVI
jgi:hypothetical protein